MAFCLRIELKHLGYKKTTARCWAVILFAAGLLAGLAYWLRGELPQPLPANTAESKPVEPSAVESRKIPADGFRIKHERIDLTFGNDTFSFTFPSDLKQSVFLGYPRVPIAGIDDFLKRGIITVENDHLFFDLEWSPRFGLPALKLAHNELSGLPDSWDCNRTDRALEIVNEKTNPIVQIYYKDDTHLVFNGIFTTPTETIFAAEEYGMNVSHAENTDDVAHLLNQEFFDSHLKALHLKRLFKYPAWKYPGQFDESTQTQPESPMAEQQWQPPKLPEGCQFISIVSGGSDTTSPIGKEGGEIGLLTTAYQDTNGAWHAIPVIGGHVSNNRFFADATIPSDLPFGPFRLSGNRIDGHLPPRWDMNYDATAIEIVNNDEIPIYQIIYKRPDVIEIYGIFMAGEKIYVVTTHEMEGVPASVSGSPTRVNPTALGLKKIFKYPALAYPGKRVE